MNRSQHVQCSGRYLVKDVHCVNHSIQPVAEIHLNYGETR